MEIIAWVCLGGFALLGFAGTVLPGVPGSALILVGAVIHKLLLPLYLSWFVIGLIAVGVAGSWGIDFFGSALGAKWGGASRWGWIGATCGAIVGIFFFPLGLILGPLLGAFVGELLAAKAGFKQAARSGVGAGLGLAISTVLRLLLALILICMLIFDCIY